MNFTHWPWRYVSFVRETDWQQNNKTVAFDVRLALIDVIILFVKQKLPLTALCSTEQTCPLIKFSLGTINQGTYTYARNVPRLNLCDYFNRVGTSI